MAKKSLRAASDDDMIQHLYDYLTFQHDPEGDDAAAYMRQAAILERSAWYMQPDHVDKLFAKLGQDYGFGMDKEGQSHAENDPVRYDPGYRQYKSNTDIDDRFEAMTEAIRFDVARDLVLKIPGINRFWGSEDRQQHYGWAASIVADYMMQLFEGNIEQKGPHLHRAYMDIVNDGFDGDLHPRVSGAFRRIGEKSSRQDDPDDNVVDIKNNINQSPFIHERYMTRIALERDNILAHRTHYTYDVVFDLEELEALQPPEWMLELDSTQEAEENMAETLDDAARHQEEERLRKVEEWRKNHPGLPDDFMDFFPDGAGPSLS